MSTDDSDDLFVNRDPQPHDPILAEALAQTIREETEENFRQTPTEPGIYRMPCGDYVEFFVDNDGEEHWLVPGHDLDLDRRRIAFVYRGDDGWQRMYTLDEAADIFAARHCDCTLALLLPVCRYAHSKCRRGGRKLLIGRRETRTRFDGGIKNTAIRKFQRRFGAKGSQPSGAALAG